MQQAVEIIETASAEHGRVLPRFDSRELVPDFLWKLSDWLGWRPELKGESRKAVLRRIARDMDLPRGTGGHAREVSLEDPERIRSWMLLFVYVAFMRRSVSDFVSDLDQEYTEKTIDVKSQAVESEAVSAG